MAWLTPICEAAAKDKDASPFGLRCLAGFACNNYTKWLSKGVEMSMMHKNDLGPSFLSEGARQYIRSLANDELVRYANDTESGYTLEAIECARQEMLARGLDGGIDTNGQSSDSNAVQAPLTTAVSVCHSTTPIDSDPLLRRFIATRNAMYSTVWCPFVYALWFAWGHPHRGNVLSLCEPWLYYLTHTVLAGFALVFVLELFWTLLCMFRLSLAKISRGYAMGYLAVALILLGVSITLWLVNPIHYGGRAIAASIGFLGVPFLVGMDIRLQEKKTKGP